MLFSLICAKAAAADRYWIATALADWNSTANWSDSASGAGGFSVPGSLDIAYFGADTTKDGDCSVNATASVKGINIAAGYDGTITQGAFSITVASTGWTQAGGTFTGSATGLILTGPWSMSGGTFDPGSQTVSAGNNWTYSGGTVGTLNLRLNGAASATITGSLMLSSLKCVGSSKTITIAAGTTLTVTGLLTLDPGVNNQVINTGNIVAQGDVTIGSSGRTTGTAVITMGQSSGAVTQTLTGNGSPGGMSNLIIDTAGTINLVGIIRVSGNWTYTAGTVNAGTSTVNFYLASLTITGSHTLAHVTFGLNGAAATIASGTSLTVSGTLTLDATNNGQFIHTGNLVAQGDVVVGSTGPTSGTAVLTMGQGNGAVTQTLTGNGGAGTLPSLIIDSAGTINLVGDIRARGTWTYTAGTVVAGTSTVIFVSSVTITGSHTLANVTFGLNGLIATIAGGSSLTVSGLLSLNPGGSGQTIAGGTLVALGDVTGGAVVSSGSVTVTLGGANNQTITKGAGAFPSGSWTVNKTGGVASLAADLSLNAAGQDLDITAGTLSLAGFGLTVNDQLSVGASGVLQLQGSETVTGGPDTLSAGSTVAYVGTSGPYTVKDWSYQNLTFNGAGGVFNLGAAESVAGNLTLTAGTFDISGYNLTVTGAFSNAGTLRLQGGETTVTLTMDTDSGTVEYDGTGSYAALKLGNTYNSLSFTGTGTWQHTAALDVNGNLAIASGATLNSAGQNIALAGNWSNGGTYTPGANTVSLDGTDQSISGSTSFAGLTKIVAATATLTWEAGATQTVTSTLNLQGASGNRLLLRSSIPDTPWLLASSGSRSCTWLDVKDGTSLVAPRILPSNSLDSLGNLNWFGDALGLCWGPGTTGAADGSTDAVPWSLGSLSPGTTRTSGEGADAATTFAVRNVSAVAVQLTATAGSSGWTIAALPGADRCWLGIDDGSGPFTSLDSTTSPSGVVLSASLPASGVQAFNLRLITPLATATTGSTTLTVTLTASPP